MSYRAFRPRAGLTDLVACTWHRDAPDSGAARATRVLPDACVDLVWRAGELFIAGPDREFVISPLDARGAITGLRLLPGTAGVVLGLPASELRGRRVPLGAVWGREGTRLAERVGSAVAAPDPLVLAATRVLGATDAADGAGGRIGPLSREFATSERQLLRRFDAAVGYGPKMLDRVLRFQRFVWLAATAGGRRLVLTHAAADLGYADQAHLSRECLRLSGLTPTQLIAERSQQRDRVIVRG